MGAGGRLGVRFAAGAIAGAVLAGAAAFASVSRNDPSDRRMSNATYRGNAGRFLELTSDAAASRAANARPATVAASAQTTEAAEPIVGDFTPAGWKVTPAGEQVNVMNFPLGMTVAPDGSQVLVSSDNGGMQGITQIDTDTLQPTDNPAANLFMGLAVTGDADDTTHKVYASGGNANRVFRYSLVAGRLVPNDATEAEPFPLHGAIDGTVGRAPGAPVPLPASDGIRVNGYPGSSVLDGPYLYVAGTLSEATGTGAGACPGAQPACGRVSVVDTRTDTVVARAPVGLDAISLALDPVRDRLYVSNWADEAGRGDGTGTVSVVNVANPLAPAEVGWVKVGHHPTAVQLSKDRTRLFVANTNDDTISVVDVSGPAMQVVGTESVQPVSGVPVGAHPDAFALSPDGETLFVALAGMNAVEVRNGHNASRFSGQPKYIPTGWYPSALLVTGTPSDYRLWVANAKGAGASSKGTGYNLSVGQEVVPYNDGTVSVIDLPVTNGQENAWSKQVEENDQLDRAKVDPCKPKDVEVSEVLCPKGNDSSPIKHVVYIVTENKTFDQYFGDLDPKIYDADPAYLLYGERFTPNHHAFTKRFSLSDRFFSDAQVSVTGHAWTSGAIATDYREKAWPADYDQGIRGSRGNGDRLRPGVGGEPGEAIEEAEDELEDPEGGYVFEAFHDAGAVPPSEAGPGKLSMAIYGEGTARESGDKLDDFQAPGWRNGDIQYFDTCRAHMFISGRAPNGPGPNSPDQFTDCAGRTLASQFTLAHWTEVHEETGDDVMPSFIYMTLPVNHTLGTNLGSPTPASMVADNDHALGMIVEALSKSPFWESTVVMQTEDDTQAAGDHISPLRDYLQVVGPWAKPGANHQWGSFPSILRTIEHIFGVEPITLFDKLAYPQHGAFRTSLDETPDTAPYEAIVPDVPFAINEPGAPGQQESMSMDWSTYDRIDMELLNAILYAEAKGIPFRRPR